VRTLVRVLGIAVLAIVVLALAAWGVATYAANSRYNKHWTAHDASFPIPFPLDSATAAAAGAGADSIAMARAVASGRHLVESRLGCNGCHGEDMGGKVLVDVAPVGYWAAPNLTLGTGNVTAGFSAHDWDLAVRHGIKHTGTSSSMPSNEFKLLSDHELSDVVAYIRSLPPVDRTIHAPRFGPVFAFLVASDPKMLAAFATDHQAAHATEPPAEAVTLEFGRHLAMSCQGCHQSNLAGGKVAGDPNMPLVANITPHETGLAKWNEGDFIRAMRDGRRPDGTAINEAMPWKSFGKMNDTELKALWDYLRSVPAVPKGSKPA
jgi:mono/diheme cytochrome c family protein